MILIRKIHIYLDLHPQVFFPSSQVLFFFPWRTIYYVSTMSSTGDVLPPPAFTFKAGMTASRVATTYSLAVDQWWPRGVHIITQRTRREREFVQGTTSISTNSNLRYPTSDFPAIYWAKSEFIDLDIMERRRAGTLKISPGK